MRTFTINSIAILAIVSAALAANSASAGGFSFSGGGGGNGKSNGGFKISIGGGNQHNNHINHDNYFHHDDCHHQLYHQNYYVKKYYVEPVLVYDRCYHPQFRCCYVYPGDTWLTICQRTYGCTYLWKHIASYNGLPLGVRLVAGQRLMLPVVNANGTLAASNAPMPQPFATQGAQFAPLGQATAPLQNPSSRLSTTTTPAANRTISDEPSLPKVAIGSAMMFSGESLGDTKGIVRLRIGEMALPVEVTEWNSTAVRIQLPTVDLSRPMKAELEVLRADGSLASKSAIELTPAASGLALGN